MHRRNHDEEIVWEWTDSLKNSDVQQSVFSLSTRSDWPRHWLEGLYFGGQCVRDLKVTDDFGNVCKGPMWLQTRKTVAGNYRDCCTLHWKRKMLSSVSGKTDCAEQAPAPPRVEFNPGECD